MVNKKRPARKSKKGKEVIYDLFISFPREKKSPKAKNACFVLYVIKATQEPSKRQASKRVLQTLFDI